MEGRPTLGMAGIGFQRRVERVQQADQFVLAALLAQALRHPPQNGIAFPFQRVAVFGQRPAQVVDTFITQFGIGVQCLADDGFQAW